jgi:hypothetical protein
VIVKKFFKSALKVVGTAVYSVLAITMTLLSGCAYLTPTREPPLAEKLGYKIPDWKGWTTTGINEGVYRIELEKLKVLRIMVDVVNIPALEARKQAINWYNMALSAGAFGGIPLAASLALKKLPAGAVKKEDHEEALAKAGNMDPEEFRSGKV